MATQYFTPKLFRFLGDLENHNDRNWFQANKGRYEEHVRQPALDFITDLVEPLREISPYMVADARTVGGSLFRINRDTRFSKDKTPYKTNTGVHLRHEEAKDAHAPGFYLHLQPRASFFGAGLWRPETKVAYEIRHHIGDDRSGWMRAVREPPFTETFELAGESLTRPPRGFDADDPLIDDLKRKDFIATTSLRQSEICRRDFMDTFVDLCRQTTPFMAFLCDATGVRF